MNETVELSDQKVNEKKLLAGEGGGRVGMESLWDGGGETLCVSEQENHDGSYLHFNLYSFSYY